MTSKGLLIALAGWGGETSETKNHPLYGWETKVKQWDIWKGKVHWWYLICIQTWNISMEIESFGQKDIMWGQ